MDYLTISIILKAYFLIWLWDHKQCLVREEIYIIRLLK